MTTPETTQERILQEAELLFRRYGYSKTTVADIARSCQMSSANIYRFFATKSDIVAAIARRWLAESEVLARVAAEADLPASERLRRLVLDLHDFQRKRYVVDEKVHEMCTMVIADSWPVVQQHLEIQAKLIADILQVGVASGEFQIDDVSGTAHTVLNTMVKFHHPQLLVQCQHEPLREQAEALVDFLIRGLRTYP